MSELLVAAIPPGTVLAGRYRVEEKLGDGAVASVYRAIDARSAGAVALKILDPLRGNDAVGRLRFDREVEVLSRIEHPAVARFLDRAAHDALEILALELIEGETLAARLTRGALGIDEALVIAAQITGALEAAHALGILHRDLKPANVMLHPLRGAVLLDFGVAWFSSAANLTRTGAVVGTPRYIAPEVFASSLFDARSDLYAIGVMLFEMIAGRPPFPADSVPALVELSRGQEPPSLMSLRPEVGPWLSAAVARMMARLPEHRPATARELVVMLSRRVSPKARALVESVRCEACQTPLVMELSFCAGCGRAVSWTFAPGRYAVGLHAVPDPRRAAAWLRKRHRSAITGLDGQLERRLSQVPVPLIFGVSKLSADQLASEARELGIGAQVLEARGIAGAHMKLEGATFIECIAALALHFAAVVSVGSAAIYVGMSTAQLASLPFWAAVLGIGVASLYTRRAILEVGRSGGASSDERDAELRAALSRLQNDRSRRLAAGAVARAAPVLLGDLKGLPSDAERAVRDALQRALVAIEAADGSLSFLLGRSRAKLAAELVSARASAELSGETAAVARLLVEQDRYLEAAIAHDVAVREALEASAEIAAIIAARTDEIKETDWD